MQNNAKQGLGSIALTDKQQAHNGPSSPDRLRIKCKENDGRISLRASRLIIVCSRIVVGYPVELRHEYFGETNITQYTLYH